MDTLNIDCLWHRRSECSVSDDVLAGCDPSSLLAWSAAGAGEGSELLLGIDILGVDLLHHGEVKVLRATNMQNLMKVLTKVH